MIKKDIYLEKALFSYFHYSSFRTGQREIIKDVLQGKDVLGVLPTGSGKSICFQLPALLMDGLTIVVSPLISLMFDQVKELKAKNFKKVAALNSLVSFKERIDILNNLNAYQLIYISPELLQQESVLNYLKRQKVRLFVIDEAHCISQWGHDFRPDYLKLASVIKCLGDPPTLALTATATPEVQEDIIHSLRKKKVQRHIYQMDRKNIAFIIEKVDHEAEKLEWIVDYLSKSNGPTLIYFSSKMKAEKISLALLERLSQRKIAFYHGGMETYDRITIQQQFMNDQLDVICCTSAFGMGINKPDIRTVIHYHFPTEIESYIQEAGRVGRDGKQSISIVLYNPNDYIIPKNIIQNELPTPNEVREAFHYLKNLADQNMKMLSNNLDMSEQLQISETKWRFLRFHFEKHGIIYNDRLVNLKDNQEKIYEHINQVIMKRTLHKERKLKNMVRWLESEKCLRGELYKPFQSSYDKVIFQCCSNCGMNLPNWNQSEIERPKQKEITDWREKLHMLLNGEEYETE